MIACISRLTALYSDLDTEYAQVMSGPYEDLRYSDSRGEIVAGLKDSRISGFWRPMVCTGTDSFQKEQIARLWGISDDIYYMDFLEDGLSPISKFLLGRGYKSRPYYTQVIDLTKSEAELYHDLRKSYKQLVKQGKISYHDSVDEFWKESARSKGWDKQQEMVSRHEALLIYKLVHNEIHAGVMMYHNKVSAYYASAFSREDVGTHCLIWQAIKDLKEAGRSMLEMGELVYTGDEKLINISKFKAGFGGETKTRLILEKENE